VVVVSQEDGVNGNPKSEVRSPKGDRKKDHWFKDMLLTIFHVNPMLIIAAVAIFAGMLLPTVNVAKMAIRTSQSQVIVYAAQDQVYAEPILREFEKETGIKVKAIYDSEAVKTVGLANRLLAEREHPQCDVFWGNEEMRTRQLAAQNVFRETNGWAAFGYRSRRIVINTNFVSERRAWPGAADAAHDSSRGFLGAPASLLELTNAVWRGKLALAFPQFGTTATHFHALKQHWGEAVWLAWCRALAANKPFVVDGNSVVVKFVGRGEAWIGLTDSDDVLAGRREGAPLAMLPLTGETLLIPNTVGVIRNAPHRANAQKLFDFLQRREVAEKLVQANALEGAASATNTTSLKPDWDSLFRGMETTTKQLNEIFLR
jgi:iron(III) transport system substrate-binding protein